MVAMVPVLCLTILATLQGVVGYTPISQGCDQRSCYPATGNLLIGREDKLSVSDTCGMEGSKRYCIISSLDPHTLIDGNEKCYNCDAHNPDESHNVSSIVYRYEPPEAASRADQRMTWWQASNGMENVTIQLDLEAEFHVTHIIIIFKSFRPAAMYVEKSFDWGKTWKIHRYFSADCKTDFPGIPKGVPRRLEDIVCQERYSRISPSTQGEVIYRVLPPTINLHSPSFNPYSKEVQDLLKTTNLRVTFTRLHKLGDEVLDMNPVDIKEKYYYSIYEMIVRGSCSCYGHAEECLPERKEHENIPGMVHGTCKCRHNTMGNNCEMCMPFFNDLPWTPAEGKKKNECKQCNCHDHATKCHFDEDVWRNTGFKSGGVCEECQHNTEGRQCEWCITGYYQDPNLDKNDPEICKLCDCEPDGTTDGGICDGWTDEFTVAGTCHCKKYAGGPRCDRCMEGYWNFTAENPDACQQCTCNPLGTVSLDGCHQETGECRCKRNVIGRDCDQCMPEHFGLSSDVLGCTPCDCDPGGAYDNNCDVMTGQCACRPNIKGRRCDQVEDFFYTGPLDYLLYEGELAHGSTQPPTKVTRKKPSEIEGETTWTGFGHMLVFEDSTLTFDIPEIHRSMDYVPVIRYEHLPSHPNTWDDVSISLVRIDGPPEPDGKCDGATDGPIHMSLPEGEKHQESVEPLCLEAGKRYQVVLKFHKYDAAQPTQANIYIDSIALLPEINDVPFMNPAWEDPFKARRKACAALKKQQEEGEDGSGDDGIPEEIEEAADYDPPATSPPDLDCDNIEDQIDGTNRMAIGWSPGPEKAQENKDEFDALECRRRFLTAKPARTEEMPKKCEELLYSISFFAFEGAYARPCDCDDTGSLSKRCDTYYGGCDCKGLVVGRRCDVCAPAAYGLSSQGCRRCDCHYQGSQDEFCNQETGQCKCHNNAYGRQCDECMPGFWNFPNCQQCKCNGHAYICDPHSGTCIDCRDNTEGETCGRCKIGYYGSPEMGPNQVQCRPCPCPDVKTTGHSYAESCYLDEATNQPICDCNQGYGGERCDICDDNYFGNPEIPGGECRKCNCSGNWKESEPGNCNPRSGECLQCLYDTEGYNCEHCKPGFFGDAVNGMCNECACNLLGTDPERFNCDRVTGKCNCLPNVEGFECDTCIENHWRIGLGKGCEPCDCDPIGSTNPSCDLYRGQCDCKPGFGGRRCDQCEEGFYGDPRKECIPCNCNAQGVDPERTQCDQRTGECFCLEGISGKKCDQCARGYMQYHPPTLEHPVMSRNIPAGALPECQECGECFKNWDRILMGLQNTTEEKVLEAEKVKVTGAAGAYTRNFEDMEAKIQSVKKIINSATVSPEELVRYQDRIADVTDHLDATTRRMDELGNNLADTEQSIQQGRYNLTNLRQDADKLQEVATDVRREATKLQEANVRGALVLTKEAKTRSDKAAEKVDQISMENRDSNLAKSAQQRETTERMISKVSDKTANRQKSNRDALQDITDKISRLQDKVPDLNKKVCDGETSKEEPCDKLCGGAGCGKCGGLSCQQGALRKAEEALQNAKKTEKIFSERDLEVESVLNVVSSAFSQVAKAEESAQKAYDVASQAKNRSLSELNQVNDLSEKMDKFLNDEKATPEQVKDSAYQCLNATMTMDTDQIRSLAEEINNAIDSVTDVDKINAETAAPLMQADELRKQANAAKNEAEAKLETAKKVVQSLTDSEDAQNFAETAISSAQSDIDAARRDLGKIETEMEVATELSADTFSRTDELLNQQRSLQTVYIANENHVKSAQDAAEMAKEKANKASSDLYVLNADFTTVSDSLDQKVGKIGSAKDRALDLHRRANNLANSASSKLANLLDMEKEYEVNQRQLDALSEQLTELNCKMQIHLMVIQEKSNFYRTCSSPSEPWRPSKECECQAGQLDPVCTDTSSPARY